jgi:hypothetical protein
MEHQVGCLAFKTGDILKGPCLCIRVIEEEPEKGPKRGTDTMRDLSSSLRERVASVGSIRQQLIEAGRDWSDVVAWATRQVAPNGDHRWNNASLAAFNVSAAIAYYEAGCPDRAQVIAAGPRQRGATEEESRQRGLDRMNSGRPPSAEKILDQYGLKWLGEGGVREWAKEQRLGSDHTKPKHVSKRAVDAYLAAYPEKRVIKE